MIERIHVFDEIGTSVWTCPDGTETISVQAWGGGGNGAGSFSGTNGGGGGGGAWAYKECIFVSPGFDYPVTVGGPGQESSFDDGSLLKADRGKSANGVIGGAGGAVGLSMGDVVRPGGAGANATSEAAGGGGSSAGPFAPGNSASGQGGAQAPPGGGDGGSGGNPAQAGVHPGGGGGGALSPLNSGASGAKGKVLVQEAVSLAIPFNAIHHWTVGTVTPFVGVLLL